MAQTEPGTTGLPVAPDVIDVVVVGAGPTGLMAAALLLRSGVSVRIVDKSPTQAKESRAFGIQARSMELFLQIGLAEELLDLGLLATGMQIVVDGKTAAELNFDDIGRRDTPYGYLLMVPQRQIEEVLAADVRRLGVAVEHGVDVTGFVQSDDGIALRADTASGPIEIRGRYLIGADGAHSLVRKALGLSFEGAPYPQTFFLADCKIDWPLDYGHFKIFLRGRRLALYLPLKGRELGRIMVTDPSPPPAEAAIGSQGASDVAFEEIQSAFREAAGVEATLSDPTWTSRYRIHHRGVNRYGMGRAFVAGDAAHIHSPAGGQGMNTGLQDAANLAWKLALVLKGAADPALLDSYDGERRPVGEKVLAYTDRLFSFVAAPAGWIASMRNVVMPVVAATVSRVGFARNKAFHFISQLGIRYHESPFVQDAPSAKAGSAFRNGPSAGHRAPDAAIGRGRDVFDLVGGYRFHLLALSRVPLDEGGISTLSGELSALRDRTRLDLRTHIVAHSLIGRDDRIIRAESGQVFEAYGLDEGTPQALYLIRPDGYIAWRTDGLDVAACRAFIGRMTSAAA